MTLTKKQKQALSGAIALIAGAWGLSVTMEDEADVEEATPVEVVVPEVAAPVVAEEIPVEAVEPQAAEEEAEVDAEVEEAEAPVVFEPVDRAGNPLADRVTEVVESVEEVVEVP